MNLSREFVYVQREPPDGFKVTDLIYNTQFTLSPQIIKLYKKTINERDTNITIKLQKKTTNERDTNITIKSVTEKTTSERDTNISIKLQKKLPMHKYKRFSFYNWNENTFRRKAFPSPKLTPVN